MNFRIDNQVFEKFPGLNVGIVFAWGVDNSISVQEIQEKIRSEEARIRTNYTNESLTLNPRIDNWRKAYSAFGGKPKENKSSVENLYRWILNGNSVRHINSLVDIYNFISLKHMLPVGGEDLEKIKGDVLLTFAGENEPPVLLLGDKEPRAPHSGEVIYKDDISAICRRWNWREAARTKLTEQTKNCILVIEGLAPIGREEIETATKELKEMVEIYCGGTFKYSVVDKNDSKVEIL
jgi:DNA/RNA-binding domain of Phe-tRNA-synthetase-like protein